MRSKPSFEPHPLIKPVSRNRVYLWPFRGWLGVENQGIPLAILGGKRASNEHEMVKIVVSKNVVMYFGKMSRIKTKWYI